ncbi:Stk1 family PASTA domain-containing Ser/Thr kinase [uncultured Corynebacterium sp.]|uniref:Stk1 family PASTA domain-containing Ser/Thr kinase n=1 Tax=uncultured Corynebacterium sp. TaxID=159447 RepID=UPI002605426A|nr:Stk1 family PASTA domain-containing Ser/Thr kinase [uncultured Corynebacterium sp.]
MTNGDELLSGRYRLGGIIGVGGMSDVYEASDTLLGREVAVKMMRADLARDENFLERFRREAKNAALLNHSSIVAVYDTGETEGPMGTVPFIVMELVQGETLRDIVRREGPLDPRRASSILADVCGALDFSHRQGIIHRDVKPANIMLTNTGAVKVMDFGIARALGDSTTMTQTAAVLGTAQYLSPEQARGKTADARSDIYSVGCVFFETLTGKPPFTGETPLSVAYQHVQDDPPLPSSLLEGLSDEEGTALDAVLLTAMAKDPSERYDTAADLAEELHRIQRGEVPLAAVHHLDDDDYEPAPTTEFAPQRRAGAGAVAGAAAAAGGELSPRPRRESPERREARLAREAKAAEAERRRGRMKAIAGLLAVLLLVGGVGLVSFRMFTGDSAQTETVAIPQVEGMPAAEAQELLESAGFSVDRVDEPHPDIPRNHAIGTEPAFGSGLPNGSSITLRVSSGREITDVPDVRDLPAEEARELLEEAGLHVDPELREEPSATIARGHVIEQSPAAGSQVSKGTRVQLMVSSGPEIRTVPDVTGQNLDFARATLESAGFEVQVREVDSVEPAGRVVEVPQAGQNLAVGTSIEVVVSRGNQMRVPDVAGRQAGEAERAIRDAGFEGDFRRVPVNTMDPTRVGTVRGTSPGQGEVADKGGTVTLEVYELGVGEGDGGDGGIDIPEIRIPGIN